MTPEQIVKNAVSEYLSLLPSTDIFFWWQESVGVYDVKIKTFRKKKSKYQINGVADICCVYRGLAVYFECKAPSSSRISPSQLEFKKRVLVTGGFYFIIRSLDDVVLAIRDLQRVLKSRQSQQ